MCAHLYSVSCITTSPYKSACNFNMFWRTVPNAGGQSSGLCSALFFMAVRGFWPLPTNAGEGRERCRGRMCSLSSTSSPPLPQGRGNTEREGYRTLHNPKPSYAYGTRAATWCIEPVYDRLQEDDSACLRLPLHNTGRHHSLEDSRAQCSS